MLTCGLAAGEGGAHPTQKPVRLLRALIELTTRPGHRVLDPFAGSGSTLVAAQALDLAYLGIERYAAYVEVMRRRLASASPAP